MAEHDDKHVDPLSGAATTGHEWDGIRELDNPLPRWWLIIFYASIVYSLIYWVFMPAWPGLPGMPADADHTRGLRDHSDRARVMVEIAEQKAARAPDFARLAALDLGAIKANDPSFQFALEAGESAFGDNCATCHGSGAQGSPGYPNLNDNVWIWGGAPSDIVRTIRYGVRNDHPETRYSQMPAFGRDGILSDRDIDAATDYVLSISGQSASSAAAAALGRDVFALHCASCHGDDGGGNRTLGAPSLRDAVWQYGASRKEIRTQIVNGRGGVMPAWEGRLDEPTIRALAIYVHSLGGGEPEPKPAPAPAAPDAAPAAAQAPSAP